VHCVRIQQAHTSFLSLASWAQSTQAPFTQVLEHAEDGVRTSFLPPPSLMVMSCIAASTPSPLPTRSATTCGFRVCDY